MRTLGIFSFLAFICLFSISLHAETDVIKFSEQELPRESVLPVFDNPEAVKSRHVPFSNRVELGIFGGATVNDPFYNTFPIGGSVAYHFNDLHAFAIVGSYHIQQQTQYVPQIQALNGGAGIPFTASSSPQMMVMGEYEFTPYYGKISITKQGTMNLSISMTASGGFISQTSSLETDNGFGFGLGLNQRLFFTRNFGLKIDGKAIFYNQYDVVPQTPQKKLFTNIWIGLGLIYLLPSL